MIEARLSHLKPTPNQPIQRTVQQRRFAPLLPGR
jgi:hypothetical protein